MNINLKVKQGVFNDAYFPYLFSYDKRFEVYYGGAGSGKSHFVAQKFIMKALSDKRKVLVIRKVGRTLKDSVFQLIIDMLKQFHMYEYCEINLSNFTITLPNGSIFLFKGLDDSEKIKSITAITDIWIEEATEITLDEFTQLNLRLRANKKHLQMILTYNPISKANWVFSHFHEDLPLNCTVLHTTYLDNKFLPKEYIESLEEMKQTNYTYYKIYALGEFASLNRLVFSNWIKKDFDFRSVSGKLVVGLDFGFVNDKTALIASMIDEEEKTIYIFKEYTCIQKTNDEIAKVIEALGLHKATIIADSAEAKSIEELRRFGISRIKASVKGADSIIHGIQKLQQYKIVIHPSCTETITEFENYAWQKDKKTNEYLNKPIDDFNHCIDALRYSLQALKDGKLKSIDKKLFGL